MEAPEKIYIHPDIGGREFLRPWLHRPANNESIEYTRTDAFVDKIENYLNSQLYDWVSITNPDQRSHPNVIPKKDFIENFRKYMKGE